MSWSPTGIFTTFRPKHIPKVGKLARNVKSVIHRYGLEAIPK